MATNTFNTRISLKYDTYANWIDKDPKLLVGEVAVVVVPANTGAVASEPAVLFKVGDGARKFSELQFTAGLSADVYDWAKAATKPTYSADEITGLSDYISGEIQDTNTTYKIEVDADNPRKFTLYAKELNGEFSAQNTITIPDETVYTLVEGTENGTVKFNGTDVAVHGLGTAAYKNEDAFDAAGAADAVRGNEGDAETVVTVYGARKLAQRGIDDAAAAQTAADNAKAAADAAQGDVDALDAKIGAVASGKTVVEMISDAQTAATYDDTELSGRVTTVEGKVTTLVGDDASKSARSIAAEEVAKIVAGADTAYDTLKEISDWISSHTTDAAAMNSAILALQGIVDGIGGEGEKATVVSYVDDAIAALQIGDYAKAAELTALAARVTALEGKAHEHANGTILDGITAENITDWNSKAAGDHKHDITELEQASGYIVFDCGSASVNI